MNAKQRKRASVRLGLLEHERPVKVEFCGPTQQTRGSIMKNASSDSLVVV